MLKIEPVTPELGAEVTGLDLLSATDDDIVAVQQAFARHSVLFIRDQDTSLDGLLQITRKFGAVLRVPYVQGVPSHPDVIAVLKEADEKRISTFGGTWHTDFSFLPEPPAARGATPAAPALRPARRLPPRPCRRSGRGPP